MKKTAIAQSALTFLAVTVGAFLMALNTKTFVSTGGLYPGGITGLTILLQRACNMAFHVTPPFTPINLLLNVVPVYIGFRYIGKQFTLYSCVMIVLNSVFTDLIPDSVITQDVLLISIFGGILNGVAISICLNAGATSGGTDFISIYLSEKSNMDSFYLILGFNAVILCIAGILFGWDKALYSILSVCLDDGAAFDVQKIPAEHAVYRHQPSRRGVSGDLCGQPARSNHFGRRGSL